MEKSHEQLKDNVDYTLKRLDRTRVKYDEQRFIFKVYRVGLLGTLVINAVTFPILMSLVGAWLAIPVFVIMLFCVARSSWNMQDAKEKMQDYRRMELRELEVLCEDLEKVQERDHLKLFDPEAYARIEDPPKPRETYEEREQRAAVELKEELKKAEAALRLKTMQQFGMPISYSSRNQYVTQTIMKDGKLIKRYIDVDTGEVELERVERW